MHPHQTALRAQATESSQRPGEFQHYYLNFLSLFGGHKPLLEIEQVAHAAVAWRDAEIARFDRAIEDLHTHYLSPPLIGARDPTPRMLGWDEIDLEGLRAAHGGLLVALFHYGCHRQVLADLAVMGEPFIAPVAKHAYFDCARIAEVATPRFANAMRLIEVESPRVGRDLLRGLRSGRMGLIYVDGNMGPDGHRVEEGAVTVNFLGRRIRVKEGIARLAQSLDLPVLPVFASAPAPEAVARVRAGEPLRARAHESAETASGRRRDLMQALYAQLGEVVRAAPAPWEFGFCLHRWIESPIAAVQPQTAPSSSRAALQIRPEHVTLFQREGEQFWVDVRVQKAYRLPPWAHEVYAYFQSRARSQAEASGWFAQRAPIPEEGAALLAELRQHGLVVSD